MAAKSSSAIHISKSRSCILKNRLTVYPVSSLVNNIGFGIDSTHCTNKNHLRKFSTDIVSLDIENLSLPQSVNVENWVYKKMRKWHGSKLKYFIKNIVRGYRI